MTRPISDVGYHLSTYRNPVMFIDQAGMGKTAYVSLF